MDSHIYSRGTSRQEPWIKTKLYVRRAPRKRRKARAHAESEESDAEDRRQLANDDYGLQLQQRTRPPFLFHPLLITKTESFKGSSSSPSIVAAAAATAGDNAIKYNYIASPKMAIHRILDARIRGSRFFVSRSCLRQGFCDRCNMRQLLLLINSF